MHELTHVIFEPPSHASERRLTLQKSSAIPPGMVGFFLDIGTIGWFSVIFSRFVIIVIVNLGCCL